MDKILHRGEERSSNFELLRIVAMLMVMVIHATAYGPLGMPTVNDCVACQGSTLARCLTQGFVIVCVNVFMILSGYFGIRLTIKKIGLFLFQLAFWRVLSIALICVAYGVAITGVKLGSWLPFAPMTIKPLEFTFGAWFIGAYLGLMLLSPVLNAFIEKCSTRQLGLYVAGFFAVEMSFDWLLGGLKFFQGGFTLVPMIGLYLCGAWLKCPDCPITQFSARTYALSYVGIACLSGLGHYAALLVGRKIPTVAGIMGNLCFPFTSPQAILGSVALFLFFSKLQFQSRIVNWIAGSAFAAYLFHGAMPFYKTTTVMIFEHNNGIAYLALLSGFITIVFVAAVLVDNVRSFVWRRLST